MYTSPLCTIFDTSTPSLVAIWPPTAQVWSPVKTFSRQIKLTLSILLLNFSRQAGDFGCNLVASYEMLVAMATKIVLTWRVVLIHVCAIYSSRDQSSDKVISFLDSTQNSKFLRIES